MRSPLTQIGVSIAAVFVSACLSIPLAASAQTPEVLFSVSIDYEGDYIQERNIQAIRDFQRKFPHIRLIHFLNAASFTAAGADIDRTVELLQSVIRPGFDELGLHIHPRKSLIRASGVSFRSVPTYLGDADPSYIRLAQDQQLKPWQGPLPQTSPSKGTFGEAGDDVPLWAYTEAEQRKVIRKSLQLLATHGFTGIKSFRAGGWSASPATWRALVKEGIFIDSSAVPPEIISKLYGQSYLMHFNQQIWKGTHKASQPYRIDLGAAEILQFPNNGGLADYQSPQDFFQSFQLTLAQNPLAKKVALHIGFHLESAAQYIQNITEGIYRIESYARKYNIKLTPATFKSSLQSKILPGVMPKPVLVGRCQQLLKR